MTWAGVTATLGGNRDNQRLSCVGVMFAPHHQASASELARVCRPGGTIGLLNWTPEDSSA